MNCIRCKLDRPQWEFHIRKVTPWLTVWRSGECFECRAARSAAWRKRNPEKMKLAKKRWNRANPEKCRAARKRNRLAHPDVLKAARKRYRDSHRDKNNARRYRHFKSRPDLRRAGKARWKRRCVSELRPSYVKDCCRLILKRNRPFTEAEIQHRKQSIELWRTQHLFKRLAAAPTLSSMAQT